MNALQFEQACEQALAECVADVATELRLVNVIDLIDYVQGERNANLEDVVNSSAELYFRPNALRYAWSAQLDVHWNAPPSVALNMEFSWGGAVAFFRLGLDAARASVQMQHFALDADAISDPQEKFRHFAASLAASRLTPPRRQVAGLFLRNAGC